MEDKFSAKPFVFYNCIVENGYTPVGQPDRFWHINSKGVAECICVHFCKQFENYPTIEWGIKYIPQDAICNFTKDGKCTCNRLFRNGQIKRIKPHWHAGKVDVMQGLTNPQKTRGM